MRRRVKAAMALADVGWDELAQRIDQPNLGVTTLRTTAEFRPYVLAAIAEACGVREDFFELPLVADTAPDLEGDIADLRESVGNLAQAVAMIAGGDVARAARLARDATAQSPGASPADAAAQGRRG